MPLPSLFPTAVRVAERYLTLIRAHPTKKYNYAVRGHIDFPVFEIERHGPKCKSGESWLYFAVPETADLLALKAGERLYVGAQTQDRMFRGDQMGASNFHHAEMRAGNGCDTPHAFLNSGNRIVIFRARAERIATLVKANPSLVKCQLLEHQPRTPKKHLGWWYEQYVLHTEAGQWRWNTAPANKELFHLFGC